MTASTPATPDARAQAIQWALTDNYRAPLIEDALAALASLAAELAENDEWGDEMAEYAREHGLPAALDHMRLIGLANIANDLSRELAATRQALEQIARIRPASTAARAVEIARAVVAGEDTT